MESPIQHGYLILADISGYTSFIAETELDHGPNVLHHLITLILDQLTPALELAEVEGDAVFVYASASRISRGELLLELIEATYLAFRNRQRSMRHNATCPCKACQSISNLNLKFITHYGAYILQEVAGKKKPVGSCVNLAHRLLKNSVGSTMGWEGYALFSETSLQQMGIDPDEAYRGVETYEHLGDVRTVSTNLDARYQELVKSRREVLTEQKADRVESYVFQAPAPVVWDWLNDPHKRTRWFKGSNWVVKERPYGRTGRASKNHCTSSGFIEYILDWHPFEYYTVRLQKGKIAIKLTAELKPADDGTRVQWNIKLDNTLPEWLRRPLGRLIIAGMGVPGNFERLDHLLTQEGLADAPG